MKRLIVLVVLMLLMLINMPAMVQAGKIGKVINLLESIVTWPERTLVTKIEQEGSSVFKLTGNIDDFRPRKGGVKVCKAENKLFIGFYFSQRNIDFYKGQVYEDGERKPVGLEIDVTDDNKVFDFADLQSITIVSAKGNSFDAGFYLDNPISDLKTVHTIGIANPGNLTPNQWYYAEFQFSKHNEVSQARFQLQVQLVGDVRNLRSDYYDNFSASVRTGLYAWFNSAGYESIPANNFFNIVSPRLIFNRDKFFGWPEGLDTGYDRFLWDMTDPNNDGGQTGDYKPYCCGLGFDPWDGSIISECPNHHSVEDPYTPPTGNYTSNNTGATEHSQPGESDHPGYVHNVSMDDTEMSPAGSDDYHGSWTFYHGEVPTVNVRVRLKNKTNHKIHRNDVTIKWFESPNHTFNPNHDYHFATDHNRESIGPFKHNSHSDELVERKTNITHLQSLGPGVYYIYPIFYYEGEENMASEHDHNEYIKVTILPRYDVENVSFTTNKTTITVGEGLTLSATVKNNYDSLPHDVRVGFYIDGGKFNHKLFYAKVFTPADLGTQSFTIPTLAPATPGSYTISMEVDDENKLAEKNENNNRRSFQLSVLDPLTVSKILPAKVKEIIFWWLRTNRLTREKEERQRVESLKIPLKLKRQIFWFLKQNHSN